MTSRKDFPIIIVGAGVFGLSLAYNLALQGYTNISIFDRTDYDKTKYNPFLGSDSASGDINKCFRIYYENKTLYSKLALEALDHWENWNLDIKSFSAENKLRFADEGEDLEILRHTGGLRINDTEHLSPMEAKNLEGIKTLGLRSTQYDVSNAEDLQRAKLTGWAWKLFIVNDLKQRGVVKHITGTLDSTTGMLKSDKACYYVRLMLESKYGVKFYFGEKGEFQSLVYADDGITVKGIETLDENQHFANYIILAAGPWTTSLLPDLQHRTQASLANIIYVKIPKSRQDLIDKYSEYPHTQWKTTSSENDRNMNYNGFDGGFAFFPPTKKEGILKINTRQTKYLNPVRYSQTDTYISVPKTNRSAVPAERLPKSVLEEAKNIILAVAPDIAAVPDIKLKSKLFWYTDSINSDFVIDFVPGKQNLIVATGGSAHGFKFLPVLGKLVVDRIEGRQNEYTELFRWKNPEDIKVDNYHLKTQNIEKVYSRVFDNAVLEEEQDSVFSREELAGAGRI